MFLVLGALFLGRAGLGRAAIAMAAVGRKEVRLSIGTTAGTQSPPYPRHKTQKAKGDRNVSCGYV